MPERIVNLLQAVYVDEKEQHPPPGPAPDFQLAFGNGHKATAVIQVRQFVRECKIAQFCLQHVLLCGAPYCAHEKLIDGPALSTADKRAVWHRAHLLQ